MQSKRTILITGSEGRIGSFTAKKFKEFGWNVAGVDLFDNPSKSGADIYVKCDVRSSIDMIEAVRRIESQYPVDAIFTAAGTEIETAFEETKMEDWKNLLNTVLGGASNACAAIAPYMVERKYGKIILLSPDYRWMRGDSIMNAVAAATLYGFAKSFGVEVAASNVMVNALSPNLPFDMDAMIAMIYYLADKDNYTTAQVVSIAGIQQEVQYGKVQ